METAFDILRRKGSRVVSIPRAATVYEAIEKMVESNVGSIVVLDEGIICGIFTERDYLRRIVLRGRTSRDTTIDEAMTEEVIFIDPSQSVKECLAIMTQQKIRHLPVVDGGELMGIVSIGDCVKELSEDAQARVRYLTDFITGQYPS